MVKVEADRDYYADLELKPSADANEIKRAFKKLGKTKICGYGMSLMKRLSQLSSTILIETQGMRWNSTPSFKPYNLQMKCSPTPNNERSTMHNA